MMKTNRLFRQKCLLFVCDIQDKFLPRVYGKQGVLEAASMMIRSAKILGIPIVVTEQTRKVMGETHQELKKYLKQGEDPIFQKTRFSMIFPETKAYLQKYPQRKQIILIGMETQVCILQTCLDLIENQYQVFLPVDAVTSIRSWERTIALKRLEKEGAILTSYESSVFDLLKDAKDQKFKEILAIIKETKRQQAISHL